MRQTIQEPVRKANLLDLKIILIKSMIGFIVGDHLGSNTGDLSRLNVLFLEMCLYSVSSA